LEANLFIHLFLRALTGGPTMSVTRAETPSGVKYPCHVCIISALSAPSGPTRQPLWLAIARREKHPTVSLIFLKIAASVQILLKSYLSIGNSKNKVFYMKVYQKNA
jgi:hypothetical protein